jgi:hypothetical protein
LRRMLGDPLFVRGRDGLIPTPHAQALRAPLAQALAGVRAVIARNASIRRPPPVRASGDPGRRCSDARDPPSARVRRPGSFTRHRRAAAWARYVRDAGRGSGGSRDRRVRFSPGRVSPATLYGDTMVCWCGRGIRCSSAD